MRKLFSLFVALLATIPLWAYDFQSGDLYYNITSDTTVEVTYQTYWSHDNYEKLKHIVIPENITHNNITYLVNAIGEYAFCDPSSAISPIISVIIPNSVRNIREYAFYGCESLTSIVIPNSVEIIERSAFSECYLLLSIVVEIGNTTYDSRNNCNAIIETSTNTLIAGCQNTIIPNSVTTIGSEAFHGTSITSLSIPNSVKSIGSSAFYGCESLTSITIPNSVTSIGDCAFDACSSLTSITIPNSVTSIGHSVFGRCPSLASIKVEEGNTIYDSRDNCNAIIGTATNTLIVGCKNTIIPNSVTTIGSGAFDSSSIISLSIPNSVTVIKSAAFIYCDSLTSIVLPRSIRCIENDVFYGCTALEKTIYIGDVSDWCTIKFANRQSNPIHESKNFYVNDKKIIDLIIPNTVDSISNFAFYGCSYLISVTIPESVIHIGEQAFSGCEFTKNSFVNNSLLNADENNYWGATIFENENGLVIVDSILIACISTATSVVIPDSVVSIGDNAFGGCSSLTSVTIPNSVMSIGDDAFRYCSSLTSVTIPNSVMSIGDDAFYGCSSLASVTIPSSVTSIGDYAFAECINLVSIAMSTGLNRIGEGVFFDCISLSSLTIPNSVTEIGLVIVGACQSLTSIIVDKGNTTYDSRNNCNAIVETATNTIIADCQTTIIPNSITALGDYTFYISPITEVSIPNSVTSIGEYAFIDCWLLSTIIIPSSVTTIREGAFSYCFSLDTIYCYATTPPTIEEDVFFGCTASLFVPCEALEAYQAHEQWGQFTNIQCIASEEVETDDVIITPSTTSVTITWPTAENAYKYIIQISKGSEIVCTLTFNMFGQLLNIQFVPSRTGAHHAQSATQTANGYCFNFTGLEENSTYTYNITTTDEADNTISTYSGEFTTQRNTPTDIGNTDTQYPTSDIQKIMHNGQLLILRDGKTYNVMGAEVK